MSSTPLGWIRSKLPRCHKTMHAPPAKSPSNVRTDKFRALHVPWRIGWVRLSTSKRRQRRPLALSGEPTSGSPVLSHPRIPHPNRAARRHSPASCYMLNMSTTLASNMLNEQLTQTESYLWKCFDTTQRPDTSVIHPMILSDGSHPTHYSHVHTLAWASRTKDKADGRAAGNTTQQQPHRNSPTGYGTFCACWSDDLWTLSFAEDAMS